MIIVSNTGPILHLQEAKCLDLLRLAGDIHTPKMVEAELTHLLPDFKLPAWININLLEEPFQQLANSWMQAGLLDPGEAEALSLARQLNVKWFLTDDAAARLFASAMDIEVHGSLGIILWAAAVGYLTYVEAVEYLDNLISSSVWMSPRVIASAQDALTKFYR
ncbi:MAG: hypothetical protein AB1894_25435 [Chloroflexota bacterium]